MEKTNSSKRLKWVAAILYALLFPLAGMVASAFWQGSLTGGIAVGGVIGLVLYFSILWRELRLKGHWLTLVLSVPFALVVDCLLLRRHEPELAVLMLFYMPVFFSLMAILQELGKKPEQTGRKLFPAASRRGVAALTLLALVLFCVGRMFPAVRPLTNSFLWIYAMAVLFGGIAFLGHILFERGANSPWQKANSAYRLRCDPAPMLEECERRLAGSLSKTARQRWLLQKAAVLADLGETASAAEIAEGLLVGGKGLSVQTCWTCFYDLADFHCTLGNLAAAAENRAKASACAMQCTALKTRQWMQTTLHAQEGVFLCHAGEYESAGRRMRECGWDSDDATQTLCTRVFRAYWVGLVSLKTGDTERAREKLRFVAENGNQLYVTARAKELLLISF